MSSLGDELTVMLTAIGQRLRLEERAEEPTRRPRDLTGSPGSYGWLHEAGALSRLVGWPTADKLRLIASQRPRMACLWGKRSGIGKTASAVALARVISPDGIGLFVRSTELVASIQEAGWGSVPELVHRARTTGLLVLDDLGIEQASEPARAALCDLVWRRADRARGTTIVTTSLSPDEVTRRYGDGMTRRLHELASVEIGASVTPASQ